MSERVNEKAWQDLEADLLNPQPTPPVGEPVVWYMGGDLNKPIAGQVTGIEGCGRVKICVCPINTFPQHKAGVYHVSAKIHKVPGNFQTKNCGSWDYPRGKVPPEDYALFEQDVAKREANLRQGEKAAVKNAELFAEKQAEKDSGKKKRLPDPLPAPA